MDIKANTLVVVKSLNQVWLAVQVGQTDALCRLPGSEQERRFPIHDLELHNNRPMRVRF